MIKAVVGANWGCLLYTSVKDLGFGEMFPSSGKVWDELVEW